MSDTIAVVIIGIILLTVIGLWLFGERWRPLSPSTLTMMKAFGLRRIFKLKGHTHPRVFDRPFRETGAKGGGYRKEKGDDGLCASFAARFFFDQTL